MYIINYLQIQRSHAAWPASGNSHEFWQLVRPKSDSKPTLFTSLHVISCADMRCPKAHTKELLTSAGNNFTTVPIIILKNHATHIASIIKTKANCQCKNHSNPSAAGMRSNTGDSLL